LNGISETLPGVPGKGIKIDTDSLPPRPRDETKALGRTGLLLEGRVKEVGITFAGMLSYLGIELIGSGVITGSCEAGGCAG
jgi:hypothetical protein